MDELANTYNAAMKAFGEGQWEPAAKGLEKVISMVTGPREQLKLGKVHYTLGAAWFNAGNYPRAIAAFREFLEKYPADPSILDARLAIARSTFLNKDYAAAAKLFSDIENIPVLRETALTAQVECCRELHQPDGQIKLLEKLIAPEIKTSGQAGGAVELATLYLEKEKTSQALDLVNKLYARIDLVDNVVALNALTVKLGDELAEKKAFPQAIAAYRVIRNRDQVIAFQEQRIAAMDKRMQANLDAARGDPQAFVSATLANNTIKVDRDQAARLLEAFGKLPDYLPGIYLRMGKAWYEWDKKWEAIVVFDRLRKLFPQTAEAEPALFSTLICYADLGRTAHAQQLCLDYLKEYPKGRNSDTVGYLLGAISLQSNDPKQAAGYFGTMLQQQPKSEFRERMMSGLGNAHFMQGEYDQARADFQRYLKEYPKGEFAEEAQYRNALALVFAGKYEEALGELNAYLKKYPHQEFAADAQYRIMVCKYSAQLYDDIIASVPAWQKEFPANAITGEVLALLADSLSAEDKTAGAIPVYVDSYKKANTPEVLNYSLFEAAKLMQKLGKWEDVSQLFNEFVKNNPDHPSVVAAMFWLGKALAHEGKSDEAKALLVEQLKRYINDPKRDAVEQLLQQLAQTCSKRPRPPVTSAPAPAIVSGTTPPPVAVAVQSPAPVSSPIPTPIPYDAVGELDKQLEPLLEIANSTGKARLLYAKAELATLRRKPGEHDVLMGKIADKFKPGDLSPVLLAQAGDYLLTKGANDHAATFYNELKDFYPKSYDLDYACVGLGEIAFQKKDYTTALELFSQGADDCAGSKIKDATVGKAKTLLELGNYEEARKLFEQIATVREWRGESTACAVYSLGEIEQRQGHWAEAIAHYQRVFVLYQRYLSWVARAYISCAGSFDKLGKRQEAVDHLKEMLRNEKLQNFPEAQQARQLLEQWGAAA